MISQLTSLDKRTGTDLTGEDNFTNVLERSNLNFELEKVPMHTPEGDEISGRYLLRRTDNKFVLGTCGKRYNIVNNQDMFAPFDDTVQNVGATYESAGIISHGKVCWVSARLPEDFSVGDSEDKYNQRVIMLAFHDGMRRSVYFSYNNRVICNNMLASLNKTGAEAGFGVRHTNTWEDALKASHQAFHGSVGQMKDFRVTASKLFKIKMNNTQAKQFSTGFFNNFVDPKDVAKKNKSRTDRSKTMINNKVDHLVSLFEEGMGNQGETRYDMMNAVTEYLDHHAKSTKKASARRFINNLGGGAQARAKRVAIEHLLVA